MAFEGDIFDIMGPVMIGPSSSHTAGAARLGRMAALLLGAQVKSARFMLHGSFYLTMSGHGTDKALVAGLMGFAPDDPRIRHSFDLAKSAGIGFSFMPFDAGDGAHPNTVLAELMSADGCELVMQGCSVGGGNILITMIDGLPVELTGAYPALIIRNDDRPGVVAEVTRLIAGHGVNIAFMRVTRADDGCALTIIECDGGVATGIKAAAEGIKGVVSARLVDKLK